MENYNIALPMSSFVDNQEEKTEITDLGKKKRLINIISFASKVCFLLGFVILFSLIFPVFKYKISKFFSFGSGDENMISKDKNINEEIPLVTPEIEIDPASLPFRIEIPKLNVNEEVVPNVDAKDSASYEKALDDGVAHALNSAFPSENKMIYIFGHSSDYDFNIGVYNEVFYQIKDLEIGDEIILHHGTKDYYYDVSEQIIKGKNDTEFVNNLVSEDILILQTCYPPGTNWKRLYVVAKPIKIEENGKSGFELLL